MSFRASGGFFKGIACGSTLLFLAPFNAFLIAAEQPVYAKKDTKEIKSRDSWFGLDKADHFFTSTLLTALTHVALRQNLLEDENKSLAVSSGLVFSICASKEIYDKKSGTGHPSLKDLVADIAGVGFALLLIKSF